MASLVLRVRTRVDAAHAGKEELACVGRQRASARCNHSAAIPLKPAVFGKPSISPGLLRVPSELML